MVLGWGGKLQQLGQDGCAGLMHRRTHRHFDRFQVQASAFVTPGEDRAQQLLYLARDFLVDRLGRFFSSGESVSWTGRARQMFSFTSSNC
jgi:hypothetical protein